MNNYNILCFKLSLIFLGILILMMIFKIVYRSPGFFYKLQSVNTLTSLSILFLLVFIYFTEQPVFIDLALTYIVINYIGIVTVLKVFQIMYHNSSSK